LCSFANLLQAWRKAARGKRSSSGAAAFEDGLAERLLELHDALASGEYRPGRYTHFVIHEPKRRRISAAPFRDRVVHHALCRVIEPVFEAQFIADSYANRVGKGTHRAIDRLQHFARRYRYVLRLDIVKHFPAIDHAILLQTLAQHIDDPATLELTVMTCRDTSDHESHDRFPLFPNPSPTRGEGSFVSRRRDFHISRRHRRQRRKCARPGVRAAAFPR